MTERNSLKTQTIQHTVDRGHEYRVVQVDDLLEVHSTKRINPFTIYPVMGTSMFRISNNRQVKIPSDLNTQFTSSSKAVDACMKYLKKALQTPSARKHYRRLSDIEKGIAPNERPRFKYKKDRKHVR